MLSGKVGNNLSEHTQNLGLFLSGTETAQPHLAKSRYADMWIVQMRENFRR
jgi:hypothetical protein